VLKWRKEGTSMRYTWALLLLLVVAPVGQPADKKAPAKQVLTGCLDEKVDYYVIRTDDMLKEIARLDPVGFDKQIFARFVGHRVSISGDVDTSSQPPILRVLSPASIKDISDMCVPAGSN
jgi:hypothetical protein